MKNFSEIFENITIVIAMIKSDEKTMEMMSHSIQKVALIHLLASKRMAGFNVWKLLCSG